MIGPARTRVEYWFLLIWGVLLRLTLIVGLIYAVYRVRFIIVTVVMATVVAFAIEPLVTYLDSRRALHFIPPPTRRLLVTFFVFFLVVLGLVVLTRYILDPMVHQVSQFLDVARMSHDNDGDNGNRLDNTSAVVGGDFAQQMQDGRYQQQSAEQLAATLRKALQRLVKVGGRGRVHLRADLGDCQPCLLDPLLVGRVLDVLLGARGEHAVHRREAAEKLLGARTGHGARC